MVIITAQLHSSKSEMRFGAGSNRAGNVSRFAMMRISDNGPGWKLDLTSSVGQPYHINNSSSSSENIDKIL